MSIEKNDEACVIKKEALEYILGLIKNISKVSDGINDTDVQTSSTFSSYKIDQLLNKLKEDCNDYSKDLVGSITKLTCQKTTEEPTLTNSEINIIYLYSSDGNPPFEQYLKISEDQLIDLGSTSISLNEYLKTEDAKKTYATLVNLNTANALINAHIGDKTIHVKHKNIDSLNKISEDKNGNLLYNGNKIVSNNATVSIKRYDDKSTYSTGDLCIYDGNMYQCIKDITVAENFDTSKWEVVLRGDINIDKVVMKSNIIMGLNEW